jgi:hypothetical protein
MIEIFEWQSDKRKGEGMGFLCRYGRVLGVAIILVSYGISVAGPEAGAIATVESALGGIFLEREGMAQQPVQNGIVLYPGDRIHIGQDGLCHARYEDGSYLTLHPGSSVMLMYHRKPEPLLPPPAPRREIHLFSGKVTYRSAARPAAPAKLISPTAAVVFKGPRAEFRTDGVFTYLNDREVQIAQKAGVAGNPKEEAPKAASPEAQQLVDDYVNSVKALIQEQ